ncbi:hypothetical protein Bhyg_05867, partial [Pseudolycoriella hygida]
MASHLRLQVLAAVFASFCVLAHAGTVYLNGFTTANSSGRKSYINGVLHSIPFHSQVTSNLVFSKKQKALSQITSNFSFSKEQKGKEATKVVKFLVNQMAYHRHLQLLAVVLYFCVLSRADKVYLGGFTAEYGLTGCLSTPKKSCRGKDICYNDRDITMYGPNNRVLTVLTGYKEYYESKYGNNTVIKSTE